MGHDPEVMSAVELFGGGPEPRDTRERLVFAAMNLFYENGFHAVGLDRVLAEVGVTKTTFYNHFESKDDLIIAVIKQRDAWEGQAFLAQVQKKAGYDPRAMLLAMFDVMHDWFNHPAYKGCLFISACSEFPNKADPVHKAAAQHFVVTTEAVRDMAKAVGVKDVDGFAAEWVALIQGALTYRLTRHDDNAAVITKRIAEERLKAYVGDEV
jgi:AcrR family transcriptional regulator